MRAGDLDRLIEIIRNNPGAADEFNEAAENWQTFATVYAGFDQVSGREFLASAQVMTERRAIFTIRYRSDLLMTDRIRYGGEEWRLAEIREIGRRDGLALHGYAKQ